MNTQGEVLLEQRPPAGIWGGLWSFPETTVHTSTALKTVLKQQFDTQHAKLRWLSERRHSFSHFHLTMRPVLITDTRMACVAENSQRWCTLQTLPALGLPAPIKVILEELAQTITPPPSEV
jgi:A/G-specific adenine glycosylase